MPAVRIALIGCLIVTALALPAPARAGAAQEVVVFAAASLSGALREVGELPAVQHAYRLRFSFAASSTLARQIEAGARASLFLSADRAWMDYLEQRGLLVPGTRRDLLGNRLVLVVPAASLLSLQLSNGDAWLRLLPPGRIATGDPAHVPVGAYARQALQHLGAWHQVEPRLARADNVRSALVLVERAEAVAGIVYATDAAASRLVRTAATFPEETHDAIVYPAALIRGHAAAAPLLDMLGGPAARQVFLRHGFAVH